MDSIRQRNTIINEQEEDLIFKAIIYGYCSHCNPNKRENHNCIHIQWCQTINDENSNQNNCLTNIQ